MGFSSRVDEDQRLRELLRDLDNSDEGVTTFEAEFIQTNALTPMSERQREIAYQILERYGYL